MKLLVTGGAGFIGSNFVNLVLREHPNVNLTVLDALTYCGNLDNFSKEVWENKKFSFCHGNILDKDLVFKLMKNQDIVVHFAAWTHIDRSISLSDPFIDTDFKGTQVLLEAIRKEPVKRFVHISTSEVYGSAQYAPMDENHPIAPQSPYAAAKAGADRLVYSYWMTYKLPVVIIRPFNNYGPNQYPEKLIPYFITNAMKNKSLPVYGNGKNTRDWLWVEDCVKGVWATVEKEGIEGEIINLGSGKDYSILDIAYSILNELKKPESLIEFVGDRPGHVKKLVTSCDKAKTLLDWSPQVSFEKGIKRTIDWYKNNPKWWEKIKKKKEFKDFEKGWYKKLRGSK
ncbi:dTDP-glucose 4,6-dehydratase [candidate division WOR-3 bacterium]|nr:dTDP-glucose 4,6-dehydratase [candidate division WOR-3 bacterium]